MVFISQQLIREQTLIGLNELSTVLLLLHIYGFYFLTADPCTDSDRLNELSSNCYTCLNNDIILFYQIFDPAGQWRI